MLAEHHIDCGEKSNAWEHAVEEDAVSGPVMLRQAYACGCAPTMGRVSVCLGSEHNIGCQVHAGVECTKQLCW
jgi:hypothetical protein